MVLSPSYPIVGVLILRINTSTAAYSALELLLQWSSLIVSVLAFYLIGRRADFSGRSLLLVSLCFVGALVGNTIGFYCDSPSFAGGSSWEVGFGYVRSYGLPDPTTALSILTGAGRSFMIPVAGLALSNLERDSSIERGPEASDAQRTLTSFNRFAIAGFVVAALALPVEGSVYQALGYGSSSNGSAIVQTLDPWRSLISGYVGFLVYPALLISVFYFLGRNSHISWVGLPKFGLGVFVAGIAGLLMGIVANTVIQTPGELSMVLSETNLPRLIIGAVADGGIFLVIGLGSACLGGVRASDREGKAPPLGRGSFISIALSVLLVILVAISGVAAYSLYLNPRLSEPNSSCLYQPGAAFYLKVVSDQTQSPLPGQPVTGQLVSGCPVITTCTGPLICPPVPETIRTLGNWDFVTNATGVVPVPASMLAGSDLWFSLTYMGHAYQAKFQICGGGITLAQLSLPSGATSGEEVPINGEGVSAQIAPNGTQIIQGCNPVNFSGNATIS
jgi:hypothetical protein